ncbi:hypothetical protein [Thermaerobacillus caldiproteolyticus]|uniref:Uncharacterized protein n=1 Tax=Thermaerobacillus caldiproteolyticus TaxID=247480 RepID=A0A7V9Z8F9_9BACL|nr:hypothetical protein [Anoxybacillus caldiproteolyticus]MBA2875863.1 hypothetical protein [Anoxybacillus caldiproteolyticus]
MAANLVVEELNIDLQGRNFSSKKIMGDPNVELYFQNVTINAKGKTGESQKRTEGLKRIT